MDKKFCLSFFVLCSIFIPGIWSEPTPSDSCADEIKSGFCMAYFPKFAYNSKTGKCQQFIYGGCGATLNNFASSSKCQEACEGICSQERKTGMCRASIQAFGYDAKAGKCVEYIYGGCMGTGNRFSSLAKCEKVCKK